MSLARWAPLIIGAALLGALALFVRAKLEVRSDIADFLPEGADRRLSVLSRAIADSELARTMILSVEAPDSAQAAAAAKSLRTELEHHAGIAWVRGGIGDATQEATYRTYFPRRTLFASDDPEKELPARLSDEGLREAARSLKSALGGPLGPFVRRIAPADPLLLFSGQLTRLRAAEDDSLHLEDDQFVSADSRHAIVFVGTRAAPFDGTAQQALLSWIDSTFARINRESGGRLSLESSGVNRFDVSVEKGIRADIQRISLVSTLGVVLLFLAVFRSLRYVALGLVPLVAGTVCAMAAGIVLFGSLHGLTLAFGSSLIGVGIDYAEHYFSHHTVSPDPRGAKASLDRIWPGLLMGAITTVAGLAGLAWTSFPGLREIAVFSSVGVVASLLATRWLVPPLVPDRPKPVAFQQKLVRFFGRAMIAMMQSRRGIWVLPLAGLMLCAVGLPRIRWIDDISALNAIDPRLAAEDLRVRERVTRADPGRFIVVLGRTDEDALAKNDEVGRRLQSAKEHGILETYQSVHSLVWSTALQRRSRDVLVRDATLPMRLSAALQAEGFVPSAFESFAQDLRGPSETPLTVPQLLDSPLGDLLRPFRVVVKGEVALISCIGGLRDPSALTAALSGLDDVFFFDQRTFLEQAYGRFRIRTLQMIAVGLVVVFLIVHARYRRLRLSLAAFLPAVLAVAATIALLALRGVPLNLLHLVGVLLVLSMGADYGIFVVESRDHPEELGATLLSLVVAMLSTVLSFGLLGMSDNPALAALGITAGLGTLLSVVFAPTALALLHPAGDTGSEHDARAQGPR